MKLISEKKQRTLSGDSVQAIQKGIELQQEKITRLLQQENRLKQEMALVDVDLETAKKTIAVMEYDLTLNKR